MSKNKIAIVLGSLCLLLTMGIFIQIKTTSNSNKLVAQTFANNNLRDQVLLWKERYDEAYKTLQQSEKDLEKIRQKAIENTEGSADKENELKRNNILMGLTNVKGEGIIISLSDNTNVTLENISVLDDINRYLVHDEDLKNIVNELKNAGAEAISINDQRVVSNTSITCEGNVINVNGEKASSPFTIKAIGNSLRLYGALTRPGGYIERLKRDTIPTIVQKSDNVQITKYTGVISSKYINQ